MRSYFKGEDALHFVFPIDGDCLYPSDGVETEHGVRFIAQIAAPAGSDIFVNGVHAVKKGDVYEAELLICGYRTALVAKDIISGKTARISVFYLPDTQGRYRLSSDDNILFLQDIANHEEYTSIFDNPYLALYRKAHDLYDAKVHLNLFYEFDAQGRAAFSGNREYFNLSMMPDRFKDEFAANADWLSLAFHSKSEFPDRPYQTATADKIIKDAIAVHREILRFAGPRSVSNSTTVHWGEANVECVRALRSLGYRSLTGYFEHNRMGRPLVAYYAPDALITHVGGRDFWMDTEEDMLFGRIDRVLNVGSAEDVRKGVEEAVADPHRNNFVSVMIHEQYFHKDYCHYLPDFSDRVLDTCRYLYEKGYRGAHITEVTAEHPLRENPLFQD